MIIYRMPPCKNNLKKHYVGNEPSPKGLGYCASGEKEGRMMKGRDGNMWIKKSGKWIRLDNNEDVEKELDKKLHKWWQNLAQGNIILILSDGKHKLIKSSMKTGKAKTKDLLEKWAAFQEEKDVKAIIWSAQSYDTIQQFIEYLIKRTSKSRMKELLKMKDLPSYLLENYKKYFVKSEYIGKKDYTFKF